MLALAVLAATMAALAPTHATWSKTQNQGISYAYASSFRPVNTVAPVVSGTLALLETLSATPGTWGNSNVAPTLSYQWQYCADGLVANCVDITGATGATYQITAASLLPILGVITVLPANAHFRVVETATNPWGSTSQASVIL